MNADLAKWIKKYVSGKYNDYEFEEALNDLQLFFELTDANIDSPQSLLLKISSATDYTHFLKDCIDIEKFMSLLIDILTPDMMKKPPKPLFVGDTSTSWTLANLYKQGLQVVPDNFNLKRGAGDLSCTNAYETAPGYLYHYLVTYCLRNKITHNDYEYTSDNENKMVSSFLVVVLDLCHRNHSKLKDAHETARLLKCFDKDNYARNIVTYYEANEKNGFGYINMCWYNPDNSRYSSCDAATISTMAIPYGLKLVGIAGTGKSTMLRRIEYILAKKCLVDKNALIPVYIELANLPDGENILTDKIASLMNINFCDAEFFVKRGSLVLLLDGFNEILDSNTKRKLAKELDSFTRTENNVSMILSDRTVRSSVPTLQKADCLFLKQITTEDKKLYYTKNCSDKESLNILLDRLDSDADYFISLDTPLKLKQLMIVVCDTGEIPDFLTETYIQCLLDREMYDKKDENIEYLPMFLQALALIDDEKYVLPRALKQMAKCKDVMGYSIPDTQRCLNLAVEMGLLVREENTIGFASNEYRDYFIIKALENELDELLAD